MGKKGKVGKSRRDKFYHLAKETGYRSRSAFKLIQLNRRFQFLQKARALLDLCAAPGGWLQVAAKFMPVSSLIVGVDLVPIKPLPNVVTLQEDITTERCRQALRKELKTWKVDVVLNDGAPNVGASWDHDAYSQAHLTLMALRLACDFLSRGGCFITKVFRSRDYQPLLWIFQQLFHRVQATKPQASRHESAEIFVVCQGFLAPDKVDSKFFDPKFAFKEVEVQAKTVTELVTKKKSKAEGYAEGDLTLYHRTSVTDFLRAANPVDFLSKASEISIDDEELAQHPATTEDIRACCQDIKVLGRKELRSLLNWRTKLRRYMAKKLKEQAKALDISLSSGEEDDEEAESTAETTRQPSKEEEEEEKLNQTLAEMKAQEVAELKRKKKKLLREQRKQRERIELKMDLPGVSIADEGDTGMFSLRTISGHQLLEEVTRGDMSAADTLLSDLPRDDIYVSDAEDNDSSLDSDLDPEELAEVGGHQGRKDQQCVRFAQLEDNKQEKKENPLLVPLEEKTVLQEEQANLWFSKDGFSWIEDDADEALEISQAELLYKNRQKKQEPPQLSPSSLKTEKFPMYQNEAPVEKEALSGAGATNDPGGEGSDSSDSESSSSEDEESRGPSRGKKRSRGPKKDDDGFEVVPIEDPVKHRILDPEGLALGAVIASSKKAKRDLIDNSFNRYAFNEDEGELPDWFVQEEKQHRIRQLPLDKKEVEHYRKRWREINARPIKKVAEAKARKKRRMLKKLEQTKKKAEAVVNTVDISEREKVARLRSLYKKAGLGKEKRQVTYVVAKKGVGRKVRRPAGVRGHFKVVDSRLKKDQRAQQRKEQKKKHKRK
ncbi:pre-rRNA 2'-O-ribose RNA methyltransferase FTSJ3 isoform X1 [Fukomys damarensis]|uniref:pre-rRNA processing protein FTSJ3 n=2 Tax=Fukomys damarensis TaxID=885580 RepID=A0A091CI38_FUKDA|nr:pre-rRNA 2'-O-ribose RNA methyltransferase FTSJ3 isoform X1 [Fukomys damarensis]XP_010615033.1 pre-rRNA 2'-O-ribose RNA methyltransferase FTSJ3 isoform X1 [Fukomys damarensis]XP_010615034.1 pre-rRNA 2'-O-ribose RNA methyltransferase FTSJ3 isoform X1 [Fukomys damarensis]XP_033623658.1 pre-rRNA 2'-O-ribose RNA methyltransferase FTSJ3 isoform X1 [Fukomys damarensis]KFO18064.1 Putative rRNA methyltransferase 3 [Fukomys damarensis]